MSVIAQVAATVTATPLPSPQVIKETFTTQVPGQIPAVVVQVAQIAAMFLAAFALSVAHRVLEWLTAREKGWSTHLNAVVATVYSVGVGLVGTATMNQLGTDTSQLATLALSTFTALSGSFWTYALHKATSSLLSTGSTVSAAESLATDNDPAQGVA